MKIVYSIKHLPCLFIRILLRAKIHLVGNALDALIPIPVAAEKAPYVADNSFTPDCKYDEASHWVIQVLVPTRGVCVLTRHVIQQQ